MKNIKLNEYDWQGHSQKQIEDSMKGCVWITIAFGLILAIGLICSVII